MLPYKFFDLPRGDGSKQLSLDSFSKIIYAHYEVFHSLEGVLILEPNFWHFSHLSTIFFSLDRVFGQEKESLKINVDEEKIENHNKKIMIKKLIEKIKNIMKVRKRIYSVLYFYPCMNVVS